MSGSCAHGSSCDAARPRIGSARSDISADGRTLASASADHQVRLWDMRTGASLPIKLTHPVAVWSVAFCPDEHLVVTGDASATVRIWSLTTGEELLALAKMEGAVRRIRFSPDARWLTASSDAKSATGSIFGRRLKVNQNSASGPGADSERYARRTTYKQPRTTSFRASQIAARFQPLARPLTHVLLFSALNVY